MHWLLKAAERNDPNAQAFLGAMYFRGGAIKKDLVQAYKWINLAAAQEQHDAAQLRNIVGAEMSPQQIAEAQRLSSEFRPITVDVTNLQKMSERAQNR